MMIGKSNILKKQEQERELPDYGIGPIVAAYFLGYLKSENGEKIADEDIEKLYIGACLKWESVQWKTFLNCSKYYLA